MVASRGPSCLSTGLVHLDLFLLVLGGGTGGVPGGGLTRSTGLVLNDGRLPDREILERGQFSFPSLSSLQKLFTWEDFCFNVFSLGIVTFGSEGILKSLSAITLLTQLLIL